MSTFYVSDCCDHGLGGWHPSADAVSSLAGNYSDILRNRQCDVDVKIFVRYTTPVAAGSGHQTELRRRFEEYADEWRAQTAHLSVLSQRIMHPSYQSIIGLGRDALPLLLERLSTHPDHWFWALRYIAGEDPVSQEDVGKFAAMRDAWIRWGRNRGLI